MKVYTEKVDMQGTPWGALWTTAALVKRAATVAPLASALADRVVVSNVRCNTPASTIVMRVAPVEGVDFRAAGDGACAVLGDGLRRALKADVFVVETAKKAAPGVYDLSLVGPPKAVFPGAPDWFFLLQTELDQLVAAHSPAKAVDAEVTLVTAPEPELVRLTLTDAPAPIEVLRGDGPKPRSLEPPLKFLLDRSEALFRLAREAKKA